VNLTITTVLRARTTGKVCTLTKRISKNVVIVEKWLRKTQSLSFDLSDTTGYPAATKSVEKLGKTPILEKSIHRDATNVEMVGLFLALRRPMASKMDKDLLGEDLEDSEERTEVMTLMVATCVRP